MRHVMGALALIHVWLWAAPAAAAGPSPAPRAPATLPAAHDKPATRLGLLVGGGVPSAAVVVAAAETGVAPLLAVRGSVVGLFAGPAARSGQPRATALALVGPSLTLDAVSWVPRLSVQAGLRTFPVAPAVQVSTGLERFVSLHTSVQLALSATWLGASRWRGDLMAGVGHAF